MIIQRLTDHLYGTDGSYRDHVLEQMINVCKLRDYEFVRDFAWYVQLLTNMTSLSSMCKSNAELVSEQLMDVTIRVPQVREFSVEQMEGIIVNNGLISDAHNMQSNAICRILEASSYIVGEYSEYVRQHLTLVSAMLQSRISSLPADIQGIFIHNAVKVVARGLLQLIAPSTSTDTECVTANDTDSDPDNDSQTKSALKSNDQIEREIGDLISGSIRLLEPLAKSSHIEVQERANSYLFFMKWLDAQFESKEYDTKSMVLSFEQLFSSELMPLHPNSQKVIADKVPNGLDLDSWIYEPPPDDSEDSLLSDIEDQNPDDWYSDDNDAAEDNVWADSKSKKGKGLTAKQRAVLQKQAAQRKARQSAPWYIGDEHDDADGDIHDADGDARDGHADGLKDRKKRRKRRKGKLRDSDIENADIKELEGDIDIEVL